MNVALREELQEHLNGNGSWDRLLNLPGILKPGSVDWGISAKTSMVAESVRISHIKLVVTLMVKGTLTIEEAMGILDV